VNRPDKRGSTPLHYAAWPPGGSYLVKRLIKGGANVNSQTLPTHGSYTPLHIAIRARRNDAIKFLLKKGK